MSSRVRRLVADLDPRAELLADELIRVPLPTPTLPPATTTNHYLVGGLRALLVDPATPLRGEQRRLVRLCRALEREAGWRFRALFLTHHHADHCGAASELAAALGLPVWAHAATAELLEGRVSVDRIIADAATVAGEERRPWVARHTPGHAPGHLVLHQPGGGVIAGDMVASKGTILIDPADGRMSDYLRSLRRLRAWRPTFLAPAHGGLLTEADAVLRHYHAHRLAREERIRHALGVLPRRSDELLPEVYADLPRTAWPIALRSLRSHLLHLEERGLAAATRGDRWLGVAKRTGAP